MGNYIKRPRPKKVIEEYEKGELVYGPYWLRNRKAFIAVKTVIIVTITVYYLLIVDSENFGPEPTVLDPIRAKWKEFQKKLIAIDVSDERIKSRIEEKSKSNDIQSTPPPPEIEEK